MSDARGTPEARRRLHPLSPLLKSAKYVGFLIVAISWQGFAQLGLARFLGVVSIMLIGSIVVSVASWSVTGYHLVGRELRIYEGLLSRRTRAIPLERLQAVDVVRPPLARLAGLSELRLEVIGAEKVEAPLAFLTVTEAAALRDRLLRIATGVPAAAGTAAAGETVAGVAAPGPAAEAEPGLPAVVPGERPIHAVENSDVLVSQLLTPQLWLVPFGVVFVVVQFAYHPVWTFVGLASLVTAAIGVLQQPVRHIFEDWDFRIAIDPAGLRLRRGLVEQRTQTVPAHRVQAVGVTWPLLWRAKHWVRCRIDVAGYGGADRASGVRGGRLLPVGTYPVARYVVAEVLPGVDLGGLPMTTPPARARWFAPLRRGVLGAGLTHRVFATTDGLLTRELVIVPYERIQSVRVVQGPLQRTLRLANVHADTAGALHAVAVHRDVDEAWWLAAQLAERARLARTVGFGPAAGGSNPAPGAAPAT